MIIKFDKLQMEMISEVAEDRRKRYENVASNYGTTRAYAKDFAGAAGEYAVHLYTGLPWVARDTDYEHDVGNLEVRTRQTHNGRLCLHDLELARKNYPLGQKFILTRYIKRGEVELAGWSWKGMILRKGQYVDGRTYLPNRLLHDIETVLL